MRWLGMVVFLVGVVVAGCFAARPVAPTGTGPNGTVTPIDRIGAWAAAAGLPFGAGLVLLVAGGVIARVARRRAGAPPAAQGSEHEGFAPEGALELALEGAGEPEHVDRERGPRFVLATIQKKLDSLPNDGFEAHADEVHAVLDEILEQDVADFLDRREELIARLGLGKFAEMIGHFATVERNTARAWSALTDQAWDEIGPCLDRARSALETARAALDRKA